MPPTRPLAAALLVITAAASLALTDNMVALIARDIGLWQFHAMRSGMALGLLALLGAFGLVRLRARRLWAVLVRAGFTAAAMIVYFGALGFLSVGEAASGLYTAPIWILLLSALFLGERVGPWRVIAAIVGLVGVGLVLNPFAGGLHATALLPVLGGVFYGIAGLATRQWCAEESAFAMLWWFFVTLAIAGSLAMAGLAWLSPEVPAGAEGFILRGWVRPTPLSLLLTAGQALAAIFGLGLTMRAYQLGEPSHVAIYEYTMLVFAAGWGWLLWGQTVTPGAALGMALIIASGATIALRSRRG